MSARKHEQPAPLPVFIRRLFRYLGISALLVMAALGIGAAGYHWLGDLDWVDAFLNASMILGGMGPVDRMNSTRGKVFATCYALFSGLVFIILMGITMAPILHRLLHKFHLDDTKPD